jgi:hypothetical protein
VIHKQFTDLKLTMARQVSYYIHCAIQDIKKTKKQSFHKLTDYLKSETSEDIFVPRRNNQNLTYLKRKKINIKLTEIQYYTICSFKNRIK